MKIIGHFINTTVIMRTHRINSDGSDIVEAIHEWCLTGHELGNARHECGGEKTYKSGIRSPEETGNKERSSAVRIRSNIVPPLKPSGTSDKPETRKCSPTRRLQIQP